MQKYIFLSLWLSMYLFCKPTIAQIIPDTTLPNESDVSNLNETTTVTGGTHVGSNLFHSFEKLSVPTNTTIYFNNPDVQNIFSRVTGNSVSNINGRIQANGSANIFLLNPNGIIFGPEASLNIGGSFFATTANSIKFSDGTQFSATTPQDVSLLVISVPIGLQIGTNSGEIVVQNIGHKLTSTNLLMDFNNLSGLQVREGKTIALVGGNVSLEGGMITAPGGKIEIGSVNQGLVGLNLTSSTLTYDDASTFKDITLAQSSLIDTSGSGNSSIHIRASNLTLVEGSLLLNQSLSSASTGILDISTSNSIKLDGISPDTSLASSFHAVNLTNGLGADIKVKTRELVIKNGGQIINSTFGNGSTGSISIDASKSVQVAGFYPLQPLIVSSIITGTASSGKAGDVILKTENLMVEEGGIVASFTNSRGSAGDLYITANNSVKLEGINKYLFLSSGLTSSTNNTGNSGNVLVNTSKLSLQSGGTISASTTSIGEAGNVFINASDSVEVIGVANSKVPSLIISSAQKVDTVLENLLNITTEPSGKSGNVNINTPRLLVSEGGLISVRNDGENNAGTLKITNSKFISLDNEGSITAASKSGGGGNIFLQADNIQLSRGSRITTNAINGDGNGGNINIDTGTLSILRNSSISADAIQGRGGSIQINAEGLFLSPDSKVTASSALGVDGTVEINTFDTQTIPTTTFPQEIVQTPEITATCQANSDRENSTFVNTGIGGIPPSPDDMLSTSSGWQDRSAISQSEDTLEEKLPVVPPQIIEAQGWRKNSDGAIVLTAEPTGEVALTAAVSPVGCNQASVTKSDTTAKSHNR